MTRPARIRLPDFTGRSLTLPDNPESWERLNPESNETGPALILGVGPTGQPPVEGPFRWLEAPATLPGLKAAPGFITPSADLQITPEQAATFARTARIYFYRPGMRLAPEFWAKLLARLKIEQLDTPRHSRAGVAWLPGTASQLLHLELVSAFKALGFTTVIENPDANPRAFLTNFGASPPSCVLSINFRGLDPGGEIFHLCQELKVPLAIWLVDNPWHLLSGVKLPWWRDAPLFITDRSFTEGLIRHGARHVHFCPLAAAPHMLAQKSQWRPGSPPLFVGRSSFPNKKAFFGAEAPEPRLFAEALNLLKNGIQPDYHWWSQRLGASLWPGLAGRAPGLGADTCSAINRARWLRANPLLEIIGDSGWRAMLPNAAIRQPVDYLAGLPRLYATAGAVLNVTSLLLPQSLNQRHFDVWAAGGLLLSDNTAGLEIFPSDLARPITLGNPEDFTTRLEWFRDHPAQATELMAEWRELIRRGHDYPRRLRQILSIIQPECS